MPKIGILESLSNEQKEQLLTWLELYSKKEVLVKLAAPPPEGFNVRTHAASLRRFEQRFHVSSKFEYLALARDLVHTSEERDLLKRGTVSSLAQSALNLAASLDPNRLSAGTKLLAALNRDDFREQELTLARERLALERARQQTEHQIRMRQIELDQARLDLERQKVAAVLALKKAQPEDGSKDHLDQQFEEEVKRAYGENLDQ